MDVEAIYAKLPTALQELVIWAGGWRLRRRRFNAEFHQLLAEYEARTLLSAEAAAGIRDARLRAFIAHAVRSTPYYASLFRSLGAAPEDFRTLADLARLPILTKRTVQDHLTALCAGRDVPGEVTHFHTSGTTGAGLRFPVTQRALREQWAVWWRYRRWHGIALDTVCLYFGGRSVVPLRQRRPPFWRHNPFGHQVLFSGYHLSPANARAYLDEMARSGARWIHGYPSLVALIATHAIEHGVHLDIGWVTLGAESILPQQAAVIEQAFGVQPRAHYGMAEAVANISECPLGGYHVDEDFAAVEFVPRGDGTCAVVGTNLSNPAFPLIRYEVGDIVSIESGGCTCGRPGRVVKRIDGRIEDYVITKSGARLGRLDHVFKDMVNIREAQIRQDRPGRMELVVVKGPRYTEQDERQLAAETRKRVGTDVDFRIIYAEELPRTDSGKLRFVVSTVAEGSLGQVGNAPNGSGTGRPGGSEG